MTIGPLDAAYLDEKSTRDEFTRVATVCDGCRRCVEFCGAFPDLFDMLDHRPVGDAGRDAGRLTPAQQDAVADECFHCGRCVSICPYTPGVHELAVDVPGLVLRMAAMRHDTGQTNSRARRATWLLTHRGPLARLVRAPAGSIRRCVVAAVSDISPTRLIPPLRRPNFSDWFRDRAGREATKIERAVTVFPTCLVEHEAPGIGSALVEVYERNGVACSVSSATCCGAPWLHAGDVARFRKIATRTVAALAGEIRRGGDLVDGDVVVPLPTCLRVITEEFPRHLADPDAAFVAARTIDASEYLLTLHRSGDAELDTQGDVGVPSRIAFHAGANLRRGSGSSGGERLLEHHGAEVTSVERDAGVGVTWGRNTSHEQRSRAMAARLAAELDAVDADGVVGDDHLANTAIAEHTGVLPRHPLEVIADADGSPE